MFFILRWNLIITFEKKYKIIFLCKKMTCKWVPLELWKKLQVNEKKFFEKKSFQLTCKGKIFKTVCGNFLEINGSWDIELFVISRFQKIVLHSKIINKTWTTKNQETSVHSFGENYLTNHLANCLQVRIKSKRVGALRVSTGYILHKKQ